MNLDALAREIIAEHAFDDANDIFEAALLEMGRKVLAEAADLALEYQDECVSAWHVDTAGTFASAEIAKRLRALAGGDGQ